MTLPNALRKLAEREPEKFEVREHSIFWGGKDWKGDWFDGQTMIDLTQDDLDCIAAEIGYEIEVGRTWVNLASGKRHVAPQWQFMVWKIPAEYDAEILELGESESFRTKLLAAQAALCAIIEKHLA